MKAKRAIISHRRRHNCFRHIPSVRRLRESLRFHLVAAAPQRRYAGLFALSLIVHGSRDEKVPVMRSLAPASLDWSSFYHGPLHSTSCPPLSLSLPPSSLSLVTIAPACFVRLIATSLPPRPLPPSLPRLSSSSPSLPLAHFLSCSTSVSLF